MKSAIKRLEELEKSRPVNKEPQFFCWGNQTWTQKEEEMMKRKYPDCKIFMKSLSKIMETEQIFQRLDALEKDRKTRKRRRKCNE